MRYLVMFPFSSFGGCQCNVSWVKFSSSGFPVKSVGGPGSRDTKTTTKWSKTVNNKGVFDFFSTTYLKPTQISLQGVKYWT